MSRRINPAKPQSQTLINNSKFNNWLRWLCPIPQRKIQLFALNADFLQKSLHETFPKLSMYDIIIINNPNKVKNELQNIKFVDNYFICPSELGVNKQCSILVKRNLKAQKVKHIQEKNYYINEINIEQDIENNLKIITAYIPKYEENRNARDEAVKTFKEKLNGIKDQKQAICFLSLNSSLRTVDTDIYDLYAEFYQELLKKNNFKLIQSRYNFNKQIQTDYLAIKNCQYSQFSTFQEMNYAQKLLFKPKAFWKGNLYVLGLISYFTYSNYDRIKQINTKQVEQELTKKVDQLSASVSNMQATITANVNDNQAAQSLQQLQSSSQSNKIPTESVQQKLQNQIPIIIDTNIENQQIKQNDNSANITPLFIFGLHLSAAYWAISYYRKFFN